MTQVVGRTCDSYEDFFREDDQPRMWETHERGTGTPVYHNMPPCGHHGVLSEEHHVEKERDGTFTVRPNPPGDPDNSNSILCHCGWHGYINRNIWQDV